MMRGVERISARNSAGYDAPIGITADPVVFTLVDDRLAVLLARRLEHPQRGLFALPGGFVGTEESPAQTAERKLPEVGPAEREASWHPVDGLPELALDHERVVDDGLWRLRARVTEKTWFLRVAGALLPADFTLGQAQRLYEALRG